jgi:hypothetical protein
MAEASKPLAKQRNVVADNEIFREKVRAEKKWAFVNENFDFNPKNLICVTEKPNTKKVAESGETVNMDEIKTKLGTLTSLPKFKYQYPQTAAQEIGWDMDEEYRTYVPKNPCGKKQCAETTYCDNFVLFQARSPFAQNKAIGAGAVAAPPKK